MSTLCIPMPYYNPNYNLYSNRGVSDDAKTLHKQIAAIEDDFNKSID